ncbi:MAG: hypothetical protein IH628_00210 [Proteobacteria bacterium]|nr:hypothetical protein [Pseudomonadota bacterium]
MNRLTGIIAVMLIAALAGCRENPIRNSEGVLSESPTRIPDSPQDLLIGTLDELIRISEGLPNGLLYGGGRTLLLRKGAADTTYVYGELTPEGYGAVVTERHTYPRGIPLITVRKTYGKENNVIVSDLRRYTSLADLLSDRPEQAVLTEVSGLLQDTILTRITRNTGIETHTFRLPVV